MEQRETADNLPCRKRCSGPCSACPTATEVGNVRSAYTLRCRGTCRSTGCSCGRTSKGRAHRGLTISPEDTARSYELQCVERAGYSYAGYTLARAAKGLADSESPRSDSDAGQ
nr:MAG TPA: hypothetical protein [Caudoviricetes sp.]